MSPDTRVNCIAPGFVPTHFATFITNNDAMVSILNFCSRALVIPTSHLLCTFNLEVYSMYFALDLTSRWPTAMVRARGRCS